jgi:hypothetical protein
VALKIALHVIHGNNWQNSVTAEGRYFEGCVNRLLSATRFEIWFLYQTFLKIPCKARICAWSYKSHLNDSVKHGKNRGYVFYCLASNWYSNIYKRKAFALTSTQ